LTVVVLSPRTAREVNWPRNSKNAIGNGQAKPKGEERGAEQLSQRNGRSTTEVGVHRTTTQAEIWAYLAGEKKISDKLSKKNQSEVREGERVTRLREKYARNQKQASMPAADNRKRGV